MNAWEIWNYFSCWTGYLTREISWSTLEVNSISACIILYLIKCISQPLPSVDPLERVCHGKRDWFTFDRMSFCLQLLLTRPYLANYKRELIGWWIIISSVTWVTVPIINYILGLWIISSACGRWLYGESSRNSCLVCKSFLPNPPPERNISRRLF